MINQDGGIWRLSWSRQGSGPYRVWVDAHPEISLEDHDWKRARDRLCERIDNELHAGEWAADWYPPEPCTEDDRFWTDPEFVHLVPNGAYLPFNALDSLFQDGLCQVCRTGLGARTNVPLTVLIQQPGGIALSRLHGGYPDLYQRQLVDLLGSTRLAGAQIRPVNRIGDDSADYVELLPPEPIPTVGLMPPHERIGRMCTTCGLKLFSYHFGGGEYKVFYTQSSIPRDAESFWVDRGRDPSLCVRLDWWRTHRHTREMNGVLGKPLFVLRDDAIDPNPALRVIPLKEGQSDESRRRSRARRELTPLAHTLAPDLVKWFLEDPPSASPTSS